jgi:hypothetical protein
MIQRASEIIHFNTQTSHIMLQLTGSYSTLNRAALSRRVCSGFAGFLFLLICSCLAASAQRSADTISTVRIDPKKPSIYLEFVRTGTCTHALSFSILTEKPCESKRTDIEVSTFNAVWLRLVNNSRWAIVVSGKNVFQSPVVEPLSLADRRMVTAAANAAEIDLNYDVEAQTGCDYHKDGPNGEPCKQIDTVAPKIVSPGVSTPIFLQSGNSAIFAVKADHLKEYLSVYVLFHYEWETNDIAPSLGDPKHRVYFSWVGLRDAPTK